jgi:hypothetical protein
MQEQIDYMISQIRKVQEEEKTALAVAQRMLDALRGVLRPLPDESLVEAAERHLRRASSLHRERDAFLARELEPDAGQEAEREHLTALAAMRATLASVLVERDHYAAQVRAYREDAVEHPGSEEVWP